jgi:hypothetical protein
MKTVSGEFHDQGSKRASRLFVLLLLSEPSSLFFFTLKYTGHRCGPLGISDPPLNVRVSYSRYTFCLHTLAPMPLLSLPVEILLMIVQMLGRPSLAALIRANKYLNNCFTNGFYRRSIRTNGGALL